MRQSAFLLAVLCATAQAQVREAPPVEIAPLSAPVAATGPSMAIAPLRDALVALSAPSVDPSAPAAFAAPAAPVASAASARFASAAGTAVAAVAAPVDASTLSAAPASEVLQDAAPRRSAGMLGPRAEVRFAADEPNLDALFDGRLAAAAADPEVFESAAPRQAAAAPPAAARRSARLRRVLRVAAPVLAAAVIGAIAPHAGMIGVRWLGQAAYWLANPLSFLFTIPQIHRMLANRSADVSASMTVVGFLSAFATTMCFAFDGKDLMMYRNLAQAAGFAVMLGLQFFFARSRRAPPSSRAALAQTALVSGGLAAAMLTAGPLLMALARALPVLGSLLVPLQILAGFGFTYMMYAQIQKMRAERSSGDSSTAMTVALAGTKMIWVWSLATMLSLARAPSWETLAAAAAVSWISWAVSRAAFARLLSASWSFLPERVALGRLSLSRRAIGDGLAFAAMAGLIMGLSAAAGIVCVAALAVPTASASAFGMYAIYTIQNLVSCVATLEALKLQKRLDGAGAPKTSS